MSIDFKTLCSIKNYSLIKEVVGNPYRVFRKFYSIEDINIKIIKTASSFSPRVYITAHNLECPKDLRVTVCLGVRQNVNFSFYEMRQDVPMRHKFHYLKYLLLEK